MHLDREGNVVSSETKASISQAAGDKPAFVSNFSGYSHEGAENFEHDENGAAINFSGCMDDVYNAIAEHEDWQEGYDY